MSDSVEDKTTMIAIMVMLLKEEATNQNASLLFKTYEVLKEMGCHDICEYYKSDIEGYISRLQARIHNEW